MKATKNQYFTSCPLDLTPILVNELKELGLHNISEVRGGAHFEADVMDALKVVVHSRVASRAYMKLHSFNFKKESDVYEWAKSQEWKDVFKVSQTFKITTLFDSNAKRAFKNTLHFSQVMKDGVVDKFRDEFDIRPSIDTKTPDIAFLLRVEENRQDRCWRGEVSIDLSGAPLSNRGWRRKGYDAPLRENLAAGILLSTDWNPRDDILIDCMCGSGTLLIEAAYIRANIPPSFFRIKEFIERGREPWDFINHKWFKEDGGLKNRFHDYLDEIYYSSKKALNDLPKNEIVGFDIDPRAINIAKENITNACLLSKIRLVKKDSTEITPPTDQKGIILCNPPYGERMGEEEKLKDLYYELGENFKKNFHGFRAYVFTGNPELRKKISLRTAQRLTLHNGSIECRLLKYELY